MRFHAAWSAAERERRKEPFVGILEREQKLALAIQTLVLKAPVWAIPKLLETPHGRKVIFDKESINE